MRPTTSPAIAPHPPAAHLERPTIETANIEALPPMARLAWDEQRPYAKAAEFFTTETLEYTQKHRARWAIALKDWLWISVSPW